MYIYFLCIDRNEFNDNWYWGDGVGGNYLCFNFNGSGYSKMKRIKLLGKE